jgi:hypothetical protein
MQRSRSTGRSRRNSTRRSPKSSCS